MTKIESTERCSNEKLKDGYDAKLGYLSYDSSSDKLSVPIEVRERHMEKETDTVWTQAIGSHLQLTIFSGRDDIIIRCPLCTWLAEKAFNRTLTGANKGHITIGRYEDVLHPLPSERWSEEIPARIWITEEVEEP